MAGQMAFSSGGLIFGGSQSEGQYSKVVPAGRTQGVAANESVALVQHVETGNLLSLQASRVFTILIEVAAARVGTSDSRSWLLAIRASTNNLGVLTVHSQTMIYTDGSAATALYALLVTAAASDLTITFSTGAGNTHRVNVCATVRITEIINIDPLG